MALLALCSLLALLAGVIPAQARDASPTVPLDDPVYERIDRLDALGKLHEDVLGMRPWSRLEIARLLARAGESAPWDTLAAWIDGARFGIAASDSRPDTIRQDNGLGSIEGVVEPLVAGRDGVAFAHGVTFALGSSHSAALNRHVVAGARFDARLRIDDASGEFGYDFEGDVSILALYGRATFGNLVFQAGRDALAWGAAPGGGLLLARNTRPLDAAFLTSESAWRLPWIFRHLGPTRMGLAVAALGADRTFAHSFLVATRGSFRLHSRFELGIWDTLILGGEGAPKPTLAEIFHEIFPFGRGGLDEDFSDHRIAIDTRWQVVPGRLVLYHESFLEDGFRPAPFGDAWDVMGLTVGVYLPSLGASGDWDCRIAATHVPAVAYRHGRWISGYTLEQRLIGDELGPDAAGLSLQVARHRNDGGVTRFLLALEERNADTWAQEPAAEGAFGDIYRVEDFEADRRLRGGLMIRRSMSAGVRVRGSASLEHRFDGGFPHHSGSTHYFAELGLEFFSPPR
ncbi:MAG TPA: capsule assembly Wzi family protein [Candidatus Eisenbacteria bacterium]